MPRPDFYDTEHEIKTVGQWTWKDTLLWSKIQQGCGDQCWTWTGSTGPHANLFGARKSIGTKTKPQMCQVPRLLWMSVYGEDISDLEIRHTCGNRYCCRIDHMQAIPNHMNRPKHTKYPPIKTVAINTPVKKQWWQL